MTQRFGTGTRGSNPYQILGLPVDAPDEQIVERSEEIVKSALSDKERNDGAWARTELTVSPRTRLRHEVTEPQRTNYEREQRWEDFVRRYRRRPVDERTLSDVQLRPDDFDLAPVARLLIRWWADAEVDALVPLLGILPLRAEDGSTAVEVRDVLFG
jgi:hypothetical protein